MTTITNSPYIVYILLCNDMSLYTGITNNLERRFKQHNGQIKGGAKYTRSKRPVSLLYTEKFETKSDAMKREYEIKKLKKDKKILISLQKTDF
jgi:putative endonuclease